LSEAPLLPARATTALRHRQQPAALPLNLEQDARGGMGRQRRRVSRLAGPPSPQVRSWGCGLRSHAGGQGGILDGCAPLARRPRAAARLGAGRRRAPKPAGGPGSHHSLPFLPAWGGRGRQQRRVRRRAGPPPPRPPRPAAGAAGWGRPRRGWQDTKQGGILEWLWPRAGPWRTQHPAPGAQPTSPFTNALTLVRPWGSVTLLPTMVNLVGLSLACSLASVAQHLLVVEW
jgi:hypothetical protein